MRQTQIIRQNIIDEIPALSCLIVDDYFKSSLSYLEQNHHIFWVKDPEQSKNFIQLENIATFLIEKKVDRKSQIWAIGGGALLDLAGFAASITLRGIEWNAVPTTLLSQIDACLGGKVAINHKNGKNLIGAFHHPLNIYLSSDWLKTLPIQEWNSGYGELIKYAILNEEIYELILKYQKINDEIIFACLKYKEKIVTLDPYEKNERKVLNLGHTLGHSFEILNQIPHGIAILMGMEVMLDSFEYDLSKIKKLKEIFCLNTFLPKIDREKFWDLVSHDKKKINQDFTIVLPDKLKQISLQDLRQIVGKKYETLA